MSLLNKEVEKAEDTKGSKFTVKRNAQKKIVKSFLETEAGKAIPAEALEAIKYLAGMGTRSQGMQIANELREMLLAGSVSSIDIFTKFGYGAPTMNKKIRDFIKAEPANRLWIVFADGNYTVAGKGENPPRGWTGFTPVVETEL